MNTNLVQNWRHNRSRGLIGSRCPICDKRFYPALRRCPTCLFEQTIPYRLGGPFLIHQRTATNQLTRNTAINALLPLSTIVIEADGCRFVALLLGAEPLAVGTEVEPRAIRIRGEASNEPLRYTIAFAPLGSG